MIEASIGQGGMGEVYRAFDEKLRRKVALKVIHPDLAVADAAARLVREARAAAALAHPNTIAIHDLGEIDGTVFLVMELVSGAPLRAYVGDRSVPVARRLRWLVDIARGLAAAHKAGLVHRDVKPTNVMISDDDVVKVLDFGLAKPLEAASFHTDVGLVVGTPGYMAPELFTGAAADARSDQYAFGVTAYELLGGAHPGNPMGPVPAALDTRAADITPAVARVVARTLSRSPADRFASMSDVASALEAQISTTRVSLTEAAPPTRREAAPPTRREAAPPTRREGAPAGANAALALAPTELQPPGNGASSGRPRRASVGRALALAVVLAMGGAYGAFRLLGTSTVPATHGLPSALASATAPDETGAPLVALDDAAADAELALAAPAEDASDTAVDVSDPAGDAGLDDAAADAAMEAGPDRPRRLVPLDDFPDPWTKPTSR